MLKRLVWSLLPALAVFAAMPAHADWLSRLVAAGERAASKAAVRGAGTLEHAAQHVKSMPPASRTTALAADVGPEGHWTFVNRTGERFTAASPDELKRVTGILAPEAASAADHRLTLVLTEDAVFRHRAFLKDLPRGATLRIAVGDGAYPLVRRLEAGSERLYAEVRPSLLVELTERRLFDEALWQLARPLNRAGVRVLALEPGGPQTLGRLPRLDPQTKRAMTDAIDPDRLAEALRSLSGQTAVLTGRLEGGVLHYRFGAGSERPLLIADVAKAAEAADVNLVLLNSATPRQPGTRNWLWQRVSVEGLDSAIDRASLADFLNALGSGQSRLLVSASDGGHGRVALKAQPMRGEPAPLSGIGDIFTDIVSDIAGRVVTSGVEAQMRSSERQRELDARLIPGIPSDIQLVYLVLLVVGLAGLGIARSWWARIWPAEQRDAYAGALGFQSARVIRLALFTLVFMPVVAVVTAPLALVRGAWDTLAGLWLIVTWPLRLLRRGAA